MKPEDLAELQRIFPETTPGKWKLWANAIMADQDGTSNVATAVKVASFHHPRTWDANMCAILQRNMPEILAALARDADVRTLDDWRKVSPQTRFVYLSGDTTVVLQRSDYAEPWCFEGATPDEARAKAAAWVREQKAGT